MKSKAGFCGGLHQAWYRCLDQLPLRTAIPGPRAVEDESDLPYVKQINWITGKNNPTDMDEKYIYALIGIALGSLLGAVLGTVRELYAEYRSKKHEAEYLAIRIVCILESFLEGCAAVVRDDGLYYGQRNPDGVLRPLISTPRLEFDLKDSNWKSLPLNIMFEVLYFPSQVSVANNLIDSIFEHVATPPDYDEGFEERQYQYSELGLKAADLSTRIRKKYKLPQRHVGDWDVVEFIRNENNKILHIREKRNKITDT
jgi:hypothetical protein